ncbi:MBL fold metallo-hydrolase [Curtobacterium sp. HSID17257]|nr:MBL fold metallo-hydrolase [Curtobacterium sp. HSID17257]
MTERPADRRVAERPTDGRVAEPPLGVLRAAACGWTTHDVRGLLRGAPRDRRMFPANVFTWTGPDRTVLFDTGYAPLPWRTGAAGWAYRRLLPPVVPVGSTLADAVDTDAVTHVVLSHLHPDHVGGLAAVPRARVLVTEAVARSVARPRVLAGQLHGLLPEGLVDRLQVIPDSAFGPAGAGPLAAVGLATADPFGDGHTRLVRLPGHADGHLGLLVEDRALLAGDAAWSRDLLGRERDLRLLPRAVAHDAGAQRDTADRLLALERAGVRLLFSHDEHRTGVDLLDDEDDEDRGGP